MFISGSNDKSLFENMSRPNTFFLFGSSLSPSPFCLSSENAAKLSWYFLKSESSSSYCCCQELLLAILCEVLASLCALASRVASRSACLSPVPCLPTPLACLRRLWLRDVVTSPSPVSFLARSYAFLTRLICVMSTPLCMRWVTI